MKALDVKGFVEFDQTKEEALQRAKKLKLFLDVNAGGYWKIDVNKNINWYIKVNHGTLSISWHPQSYGNGGFMIMNSGRNGGVGSGDVDLTTYHPKNSTQLLRDIEKSITEFKARAKIVINHFNINEGLKCFKKITL